MNLIIALSVVFFSITTTTYGAPIYNESDWSTDFDGQRAWNRVEVLASDSLGGRYSGFQGSDKADNYITSHFSKLGIDEPFKETGYFHEFTYGAGEYSMPSSLIFHFEDSSVDTAYMWEDFNIYKYSGFGNVSGRIIFGGYGISSPEKGWDDYAGLDLTGAIVLVMRGTPDIPNVKWDSEAASGSKSTTALERGAVGFMMTQGGGPKYATISEKYYREEIPAVWISSIIADSLLKETGKNIAEWTEEIKSTGKPVSQLLSVSADLQVTGQYYPERQTHNIVGVIPGYDKELSREAIMIGAHMDHHGVDAAGNVYPGADDNASGTAAMMELAEIFSTSTVKYPRTLMFAAFAAEEEGLVGSNKLVKDLPIGDYKIVSMINMDMVGQGDGTIGIGGINEFPRLGELMFLDYADSTLEELAFWGLHGSSDHAAFHKAGIPSYVVGARGKHPNYHTPYDTVGAIKPDVLKAVGDMVYHCASTLATYPKPLLDDVDKAEWLLRRKGTVQFVDFDGELESPFERINGVPYPVPLMFMNIPFNKKSDRPFEEVLNKIETARDNAEQRFLPFMADSLDKDYKGDTFLGASILLSGNVKSIGSTTLTSLSRLGLSLFDVTEILSKHSKPNKKFKKILATCKEANVIPLVSNVPIGSAMDIAKSYQSKIIFKSNKIKNIDWDDMIKLCEQGCFVLLDASAEIDIDECNKLSKGIKQILDSDVRDHFGVMGTPCLIQALLNQDIANKDITNLNIDNLRITLRDWRAIK